MESLAETIHYITRVSNTQPYVHMTWPELPNEIFALILSHLPLRDNIRASSVCKTLLVAAISVRVADKPMRIMSFPQYNDDDFDDFYDPSQKKIYGLDLPELHWSTVCYAREDPSEGHQKQTNSLMDCLLMMSFGRIYNWAGRVRLQEQFLLPCNWFYEPFNFGDMAALFFKLCKVFNAWIIIVETKVFPLLKSSDAELKDNIRASAVSKSCLAAAIYVRVSNKPPWLMVFPRSGKLYKFYYPSQRKTYWLELPELDEAKLRDNIRASSVCKTWLAAAISVRVADKPIWIMSFPQYNDDDFDDFYDPSQKKIYGLDLPELHGSKVCYDRDGWLLLSKTTFDHVFFCCPYTKSKDNIRASAVSKSWLAAAISVRVSNKPRGLWFSRDPSIRQGSGFA
ncbi:hypothetical protein RD792_014250 [Penstemon davidsonii]|uniref:F-box domain-containing protein n=1 Tax=Penstemon davidsonii TaxID=160366 RepID=A0ABR0CNS9_9LAMI|nr:hypothetical protein RD792_014250 [Penstemon davidsonii]